MVETEIKFTPDSDFNSIASDLAMAFSRHGEPIALLAQVIDHHRPRNVCQSASHRDSCNHRRLLVGNPELAAIARRAEANGQDPHEVRHALGRVFLDAMFRANQETTANRNPSKFDVQWIAKEFDRHLDAEYVARVEDALVSNPELN